MRIADSIIIYGGSGTYKTSAGYHFAKYIYETTGKKTRVVSADGGGISPILTLQNVGIADIWQISTLKTPLAVMRKLSRGAWPKGLLPTGQLDWAMPTDQTWEEIGGYFLEGLTSFGDAVMRELRTSGAKLAQDPSYSLKSGDEMFYGSNQTYYGFVQDVLNEFVLSFSQLPVRKILWTALEAKGEDEITRQIVYGPSIAGKKSISKAPSWFGDCIHHDAFIQDDGVDLATKTKKVKVTVRAYFQMHPDATTGIVYPAKPRLEPPQIAGLSARWPEGFFVPTLNSGIDEFLKTEDLLMEGGTQQLEEWKQKLEALKALATAAEVGMSDIYRADRLKQAKEMIENNQK